MQLPRILLDDFSFSSLTVPAKFSNGPTRFSSFFSRYPGIEVCQESQGIIFAFWKVGTCRNYRIYSPCFHNPPQHLGLQKPFATSYYSSFLPSFFWVFGVPCSLRCTLFIIVECMCHREWNLNLNLFEVLEYRGGWMDEWMDG